MQRSGDERALRRHRQWGSCLDRARDLDGIIWTCLHEPNDDVTERMRLGFLSSKMESLTIDMSDPAVQDFLSLVRSVLSPLTVLYADPPHRLQVLTPLSLLVNIATVLVCSTIVGPSICAYSLSCLTLTLTGMIVQSASSDSTLLRSRPTQPGSPSISSLSTSSRSVIVSYSYLLGAPTPR